MPKNAWLLAVLGLVVAAVPTSADEWSHRYTVSGRPDVQIKTGDGAVRVETGAGTAVEVVVTSEGWTIGEGGVTVIESQTGNRVSVEVREPRGHWTGRHSLRLAVRMPSEADLAVQTGDGPIDVQPVHGKVTLSTGDGPIATQGLTGELRLSTGDGSIKAVGLEGRVHASSGDGSLNVRGRFDALNLSTGDGSIDAAAESGSKVAEPWSLSSGDGGVVLRVPDGLSADVEAHSGDGSVDVGGAGVTITGHISENHVRGKLGAGGPLLRLHTGDGSIRLLKL
jgi:hypothetical protein